MRIPTTLPTTYPQPYPQPYPLMARSHFNFHNLTHNLPTAHACAYPQPCPQHYPQPYPLMARGHFNFHNLTHNLAHNIFLVKKRDTFLRCVWDSTALPQLTMQLFRFYNDHKHNLLYHCRGCSAYHRSMTVKSY